MQRYSPGIIGAILQGKNQNSGKASAHQKVTQRLVASIGVMTVVFALLLTNSLFANTTPDVSSPRSSCPPVEEEIVDIDMLIDMVTKTKAISLFGKLKLKKELNKLLARLEDYNQGDSTFSLEQLEEQYNMMLMRITVHIQDKDEMLHHQLCNSWLVIWEDMKNYDKVSGSGP
jgi:hypothetical protein